MSKQGTVVGHSVTRAMKSKSVLVPYFRKALRQEPEQPRLA